MDEIELYKNDRPKWLELVAPKMAARIADDTYDDDVLQAAWAGMERDYQTAVWQHLDDTQRARIRALRAAA